MLLGDVTAESIQTVLPRVREGLGGNQRTSPINLMPPFQRLLLGVAGSCRFPNAPDDVWFTLRSRHIVIHKPLRASIAFNFIKNNVLRIFLGLDHAQAICKKNLSALWISCAYLWANL